MSTTKNSYSLEQMLGTMDVSVLDEESRKELYELLHSRDEYLKYNKIETFKPYDYQKKFYAASKNAKRRFLCAANRG